MSWVERNAIPPDIRTGILVGFLGGFTTFSAYALQSARLLEEGALLRASLYLLLSPVLGLGACFTGLKLARALFPAGTP
jgi:fluoride exporter